MMFIFRAIFWLAVVSAILPPRASDEAGLGETAGRMAGAAMDYCAARPAQCLESAAATVQAVRIPAELFMKAQAMPQPEPRPASL